MALVPDGRVEKTKLTVGVDQLCVIETPHTPLSFRPWYGIVQASTPTLAGNARAGIAAIAGTAFAAADQPRGARRP